MDWSMVGLGCAGGALPDIIRVAQNRYRGELSVYLKTLSFWIGVMALVALGGLAAWLGEAKEAKEALAYGFGGPALLSRLLSSSGIDRSSAIGTIRRWWAF